MKNIYKTDKFPDDFRKLQEKWYKKLEDSGFKDAEQFDSFGRPRELLQNTTGQSFSSTADAARKWAPDAQRYFELARQHLWTIRDNPHGYTIEDIDMWEKWSDGESMAEIGRMFGRGYPYIQSFIAQEESKFLPKRKSAVE